MADDTKTFHEARQAMEASHRVLLLSHRKPDGDTLGAACGWNLYLKALGKETTLACIDETGERYAFLPDVKKFVRDFDLAAHDLIVVSDAGADYMTGFHEKYPELYSGAIPVVNVDHHASNTLYGTINLVDSVCPATTIVMYRYFRSIHFPIRPDMATCLLTGIYNDTGSLMHSNTTREVYEICADLVMRGARLSTVARNLFRTNPISTLKLWGKVLEHLQVNAEGIAVSAVTKKDYEQCGADSDATSGVIDLMNSVPGTRFTVLLHEDEKGNVKGSFRTLRDDVDLSKIAGLLGGGGHKKASGFTVPGKLEQEMKWRIVTDNELPPHSGGEKTGFVEIEERKKK